MSDGWVKLHRSLLESSVFTADDGGGLLRVWVWCLLSATHTGRQTIIGEDVIDLRPGEFVFGRKKAAEAVGMPQSTLYDKMQLLEKLGNIRQMSGSRATVVTVVNWDTYQQSGGGVPTDVRQAGGSSAAAGRQPTDTIQEGKNGRREEGVRAAFVPPTKEMIWLYAVAYRNKQFPSVREDWLKARCADFFDYFEERAWVLTTGKKMSKWNNALARWLRRDVERSATKGSA